VVEGAGTIPSRFEGKGGTPAWCPELPQKKGYNEGTKRKLFSRK